MGAFGLMGGEYEQVVYNHDPASGLKAIIAIHSTALGPALGGNSHMSSTLLGRVGTRVSVGVGARSNLHSRGRASASAPAP